MTKSLRSDPRRIRAARRAKLPVVRSRRPGPGRHHPASAADVREALRSFGEDAYYGLVAIELMPAPATPKRLPLGELIGHRSRVKDLIGSGRPHRHGLELTDPEQIRRSYVRLGRAPKRYRVAMRRTRPPRPLVSVVIPYHGLHDYVERAVNAAFAQTHRELEVILVNDGSFDLEVMGPRVEEEGYHSTVRRSVERASELLDRVGA